MKSLNIFFFLVASCIIYGQHNPRVVGIDLTPDNSPGRSLSVYDCGQVMSSSFNFSVAGLTAYPVCGGGIIMTISILNWNFVDQSIAANNISDNLGWKSLFSWSFSGSQTIVATQIASIPSTGSDPFNPIQTKFEVALKVPLMNSLNGSPLGIQVQLSSIPQVPGSCSGNNNGDDANTTNGTVFCVRTLPIQLFELNSLSRKSAGLNVEWKTQNESNTDYFEIYRLYHGNQNNWMKVGKIDASGESHDEITYNFIDNTYAKAEKIYYKIKLVDQNGSIKYTDIKGIELKENSAVKLTGFPNPVQNIYHLSFNSQSEAPIQIEVIDLLGKVTFKQKASAVKGYNQYDLELKDIAAGTYVVKVSGKEINQALTLIKTQ